jgi:hypothetical protein
MLSRFLYYRSYPLYTYDKWWYTDKYKQKLRKYSLTDVDFLVKVVLSELQVDETGNYTDYEETKMITITDNLSDFIVDFYNTYYKTSVFHCGNRYMKMETTCHRGIFHVTGKVLTGLVDIIIKKACNASAEPVEYNGSIYVVYGFEVHNI